jgi:hypothetical protein
MHLAASACVCTQAQQQQTPLLSCSSSSNRVHTDPLKLSTSGGDRHLSILVSSGTTPCHAGVCSFVCLRSGTTCNKCTPPWHTQSRRCATDIIRRRSATELHLGDLCLVISITTLLTVNSDQLTVETAVRGIKFAAVTHVSCAKS